MGQTTRTGLVSFRFALGITCMIAIACVTTNSRAACCLSQGCMELSMKECASLGGTFFEGSCGDNDTDGDGVRDECDLCPANPNLIALGTCGCDVPDFVSGVTFGFQFGNGGSTNGQFNFPADIAIDAAGRILVTDRDNDRIQVFDEIGTFQFAFGTSGSRDGQFNQPQGVDVGTNGRIYVADFFGNRVQAFDHTGAFLFAFGSAGAGDGQFFNPLGVAINSIGWVYVSDQGNHRVQVFDSDGSFLFKFGSLGSAAGQFIAPGALAVDMSGQIYVTDRGNDRVQVFDDTGSFLFAFGSSGAEDSEFHDPRGITVDARHIYVADAQNHRVQVFDRDGNFQSVIGSGGSGNGQFNLPVGVALDALAAIYVVDQNNQRVQVLNPIATCPGACCLSDGSCIEAATPKECLAAGGFFQGESVSCATVACEPFGACCLPGGCMELSAIKCASFGGTFLGGATICTDPDNDGDGVRDECDQCATNSDKVLVGVCSCEESDTVSDVVFSFASERFNNPNGVCVDATGSFYVADTGNNQIHVFGIDNKGPFSLTLGPPPGQTWLPKDVAVDTAGRIYVADAANERVLVIDRSGNLLFAFGKEGDGEGEFKFIGSVEVDIFGRILVPESGNDRVQVFDNAGEFLFAFGELGSADGQLNNPEHLATDSSGRIYVADRFNSRVQVFDSSGISLYSFGGGFGNGEGQFNGVVGIDVDPAGHIWVTDSSNDRIQVFDNWGNIQFTYHGADENGLDSPIDIAIGPAGRVFVTDFGNDRIQVLNPMVTCPEACCLPSGLCLESQIRRNCLGAQGVFVDKGVCEPELCLPRGACCLPSGCMELTEDECVAQSGTFLGPEEVCSEARFDADGDGLRDECDLCPNDPEKVVPGLCGCGIPDVLTDVDVLFSFGSFGSGDGQFKSPNGVAVDALGRIYVADTMNDRIQVFGSGGEFLFAFGDTGSNAGEFMGPDDIAVDSRGRLYVSDRSNNRVQVFDKGGEYLLEFGGFGEAISEFNDPSGIALSVTGRIHVSDKLNERLQILNSTGFVLFDAEMTNKEPKGIAVDTNGWMYALVDASPSQIGVFDSVGNLQSYISGGTGPDQLGAPHDLAIDATGLIYIADTFYGRLQVFNTAGTRLHIFDDLPLNMPHGIAIDVHSRIYIADRDNHQVQVLERVFKCSCAEDIVDASGTAVDASVDIFDLLVVLENWGTDSVGAAIAAPFDVVDVFDLLRVLEAWGPCP